MLLFAIKFLLFQFHWSKLTFSSIHCACQIFVNIWRMSQRERVVELYKRVNIIILQFVCVSLNILNCIPSSDCLAAPPRQRLSRWLWKVPDEMSRCFQEECGRNGPPKNWDDDQKRRIHDKRNRSSQYYQEISSHEKAIWGLRRFAIDLLCCRSGTLIVSSCYLFSLVNCRIPHVINLWINWIFFFCNKAPHIFKAYGQWLT